MLFSVIISLGVTGFDLETKYEWHAEDVGWPPKSSDITINAKNQTSNEELLLAA
jgi:hypothetical protein